MKCHCHCPYLLLPVNVKIFVFCTLLLPLSIVSVVEICFVMFMQLVIVRDGD